MTLLLQRDETIGILSLDEIREAVHEGFREQSAGEVQLPPRTTTDSTSGRGWIRIMPAIMNRSGLMGFKAMHSTPGIGVRYVVMLYSLETGELLSIIDADWLTARRTAATAAVGVDLLAQEVVSEAGVLGSSEQARSMLAAVARVRTLKRVKVYSPTKANRTTFAEMMGRELDLDVVPVESAEQAFRSSGVVLSVFRAGADPTVSADWLEAGVHLHAASSVRAAARELTDGVWARADIVAVDDPIHVFESGDGISALASRAIREDRVIGIWDVLGGARPGRQRKQDVTLFKAVGTGLQDLALAAAIYRKAKDSGIGIEIADFPLARR